MHPKNLIKAVKAKKADFGIAFDGDGDRVLFVDSQALFNKPEAQFTLRAQSKWLGDVEQSLLINNCLVSTSPGGYHVPEPAAPGLFVSQPLILVQGKGIEASTPKCIDYTVHFANQGLVTAIAKSDHFLAVAFGQKILLLRLSTKNDQLLAADPTVQEIKVNFHTRYLSFVGQEFLVCAGHDIGRTESPTDWSALNGGGFTVLDIVSQKIVSHHLFNQELAWGNGGQCLTVFKNNSDIYIIGVDKQANLYSWHWQTGLKQILFQSHPENKSINYGISHFVWQGTSLFCGFNRAGNRLHKYTFCIS